MPVIRKQLPKLLSWISKVKELTNSCVGNQSSSGSTRCPLPALALISQLSSFSSISYFRMLFWVLTFRPLTYLNLVSIECLVQAVCLSVCLFIYIALMCVTVCAYMDMFVCVCVRLFICLFIYVCVYVHTFMLALAIWQWNAEVNISAFLNCSLPYILSYCLLLNHKFGRLTG